MTQIINDTVSHSDVETFGNIAVIRLIQNIGFLRLSVSDETAVAELMKFIALMTGPDRWKYGLSTIMMSIWREAASDTAYYKYFCYYACLQNNVSPRLIAFDPFEEGIGTVRQRITFAVSQYVLRYGTYPSRALWAEITLSDQLTIESLINLPRNSEWITHSSGLTRRARPYRRTSRVPTGQDPVGRGPTGQDPTGLDPTGQDPAGQTLTDLYRNIFTSILGTNTSTNPITTSLLGTSGSGENTNNIHIATSIIPLIPGGTTHEQVVPETDANESVSSLTESDSVVVDEGNVYTVEVRRMSQSPLTITLNRNKCVGSLKRAIAAQLSNRTSNFRLVYEGMQLLDHNKKLDEIFGETGTPTVHLFERFE